MARRDIPADHPPFAALPVRMITVGLARDRLAVHVAGRLGGGRMPLLCVPGYTRNMSDFTEFAVIAGRQLGADWPIVLIDLRGRGRSADRARADDYTTTADARDLVEMARALAIEDAIVVGQGHGGQVAMAMAALRPALIAGTVLIDAGPATEPRSLIRLRSNIQAITTSRGVAGLTVMLRRMLAADYPGLDHDALDRLAARTQVIGRQGRAELLFDKALIERLRQFDQDDVLVPQWPLFGLLAGKPLLLVRSEFTDQLSPHLLEEMHQHAPEAERLVLSGQGSPPLLDRNEEVAAITAFVRRVQPAGAKLAMRA